MPNLHPILAGTPATFLLVLILFELLRLKRPDWITKATLKWLLVLCVTGVALTFFSGYQALDFINRACFVPEDVIAWHHTLGKVLLIFTLSMAVFGYFRLQVTTAKFWLSSIYFCLLIICFALVSVTGFYGGQLVFKHGVTVTAACHN